MTVGSSSSYLQEPSSFVAEGLKLIAAESVHPEINSSGPLGTSTSGSSLSSFSLFVLLEDEPELLLDELVLDEVLPPAVSVIELTSSTFAPAGTL